MGTRTALIAVRSWAGHHCWLGWLSVRDSFCESIESAHLLVVMGMGMVVMGMVMMMTVMMMIMIVMMSVMMMIMM